MKKAETWARTRFSWMKPADIVPLIRAIQEDAIRDYCFGVSPFKGEKVEKYYGQYVEPK